jgi:hypothetical protein
LLDLFGHQSWPDIRPIAERAWNMAGLLDGIAWAEVEPTVAAAWTRASGQRAAEPSTLQIVAKA